MTPFSLQLLSSAKCMKMEAIAALTKPIPIKVLGYILLINIHENQKPALYTYKELYFTGLFTVQR